MKEEIVNDDDDEDEDELGGVGGSW